MKAFHLLLTFVLVMMKTSLIDCKKEYIKVSYPHITKHENHVTKIPDLKIETVPVEKEIKVLVPYKVPYEVKVPYIVQQKVHTSVEHKPVYTSHHVYHKKPYHHSNHHHSSWQPTSYPHPQHDDGNFFLSQASDVTPLYVSSQHQPVDASQTLNSFTPFDTTQQISNQKVIRADLNDFTSTLHTSAFNPEIGFGSQEGLDLSSRHQQQQQSYDGVNLGPVMFNAKGVRERGGKFYYTLVPSHKSEHPGLHYGYGPLKGE